MGMADNEYKPEDEGSLDEFEKDVIAKEKKKTQRNLAVSVVLVAVLAGGGYYLYSNTTGGPVAPVPIVVPTPTLETTAPVAPPVAPPAAAPAKVEAKKEEPPKKTAVAETKTAAGKTEAAKPAKSEAKKGETKKDEPVKKIAVTEAKAANGRTEAAKTVSAPGSHTLQLGVFAEKANAEVMIKQLEKLGFKPETIEKQINIKSIGIYTGYYRYRELAAAEAAKISRDGFENRVVLKVPGNYTVEVGTYKTDKEADVAVKKLNEKGYKVSVDYTAVKKPATVVLLRNIESADRLKEITETLAEKKIDFVVIRKK